MRGVCSELDNWKLLWSSSKDPDRSNEAFLSRWKFWVPGEYVILFCGQMGSPNPHSLHHSALFLLEGCSFSSRVVRDVIYAVQSLYSAVVKSFKSLLEVCL
jgi:hypothetical protein